MFPSRRITTMGGDVFRDEWSLDFDGTNDYIDCGVGLGTALGDNYTGDLSVSIWFKANDTTGGLFQIGSGSYGDFAIRLNSNELMLSINNTGWEMIVAFTDTTNWNHVVGVLDGGSESTTLLYLNGVSVGAEDDTFPATSTIDMDGTNTQIGKVHTVQFDGKISEVAAYNTALTASEVKTLYNGREPYNHKEGIASGNLQGWWRMGDGRLDGQPPVILSYVQLYNGIVGDEAAGSYVKSTELVTNGTFTGNASGWTLNTGWAYDDNNITCSSGSLTAEQDISAAVGKVYKLTFDSIGGANAATVKLGGSNAVAFTGTASHEYYFTALTTGNLIFTSASYTGTIDNVSVKEVTGYAGTMINMTQTDFVTDVPR